MQKEKKTGLLLFAGLAALVFIIIIGNVLLISRNVNKEPPEPLPEPSQMAETETGEEIEVTPDSFETEHYSSSKGPILDSTTARSIERAVEERLQRMELEGSTEFLNEQTKPFNVVDSEAYKTILMPLMDDLVIMENTPYALTNADPSLGILNLDLIKTDEHLVRTVLCVDPDFRILLQFDDDSLVPTWYNPELGVKIGEAEEVGEENPHVAKLNRYWPGEKEYIKKIPVEYEGKKWYAIVAKFVDSPYDLHRIMYGLYDEEGYESKALTVSQQKELNRVIYN